MRRHGIRALTGPRFRPCTTDSRPYLPIAPNLPNQAFVAAALNRVWLADIAPASGRTRIRASINPRAFARFEGGTSPVAAWLAALRQMALAGYPVGLTIAPIIAADRWRDAYGELIHDAAAAVAGVAALDLTIELITHRFTAGSKAVPKSWYPGSPLDMGMIHQTTKHTRFGTEKQVYDAATMRELRGFFEARLAVALPAARLLYWT